MSRTFLSSTIGVPLAVLAMTMMFTVEMVRVSGRSRPFGLRTATVLVVAALVVFIGVRFMVYS
jgi:hypothetical protein